MHRALLRVVYALQNILASWKGKGPNSFTQLMARKLLGLGLLFSCSELQKELRVLESNQVHEK